MISVDEKVMVLENEQIIGTAYVKDVCKNKRDLTQYFQKGHPKLTSYELAVRNDEPVYIVDFNGDMGQAAYLKKNLRKLKKGNLN